jgi:hypothetical protein
MRWVKHTTEMAAQRARLAARPKDAPLVLEKPPRSIEQESRMARD